MATLTSKKGLGAVIEKVRDGATLKAMLLKSGHETQAALGAYVTVTALLAGSGNDRADAAGYADVTITGAAVDETVAGQATLDSDPLSFPATAAGNSLTQLVIYESTGSDATSVPLINFDVTITTDGNAIVIDPNALGLWQAVSS